MLHYTKTLLYAAAINVANTSAIQYSTFLNPLQVNKHRKLKNSDIFFTISGGFFFSAHKDLFVLSRNTDILRIVVVCFVLFFLIKRH